MRRTGCGVILFFAAILTFAQQAEVVYVEGLADIREAAGSRYEATFGDGLYAGDAVLTGSDGRVDLEQADSSTIRIAADTVFTVKEVGISGERNTVYSTPVGSAFFRFRTLVGKEPRVSTPSSTAGVRGTAFAVFAGVDGSTLYVVEEGRVDVTAQGTTVELGAGEGVEVSVGSQPGEKFEVKRGQIDYADWNAERLNAMLEDPVAAVAGVARRMDEFVDSIREIAVEYEENRNRLESERDKLESIEEEKGKDARTQYYSDTVFPLEVETSYQRLNLRYYALSALSLRRYVMAGIYLRVKPRYLTNPRSDVYLEFLSIYRTAADQFEREITPYLVDADF